MKEYFWKKKELFYFILSIMILLCHSTGYKFYDANGIVLNEHTRTIVEILWNKINAWVGVAGFFLCSAFFLFGTYRIEDTLKKWKKRFYRLGIPYIFWNIVGVLWAIMIETLPFLKNNVTGTREHFSFGIGEVLNGVFLFKYNPPMWYILQLLIFVIATPLLYILLKNRIIGAVVVFCSYLLYGHKISLYPFLIMQARQDVLFYYILGAYLGIHTYQFVLNQNCWKKGWSLCALIGLGIMLVLCDSLKPSYSWLDMPQTLLIIILLWYGLDFFSEKIRNINWWGIKISFFIYATHDFIEPCVNKLIWIFLPHNDAMAIFNVVAGAGVTLLIIFLMAYVLKNHFRTLWKVMNGEKVK